MDPKELRGLYEAYAEVYAPQEVDEAITSEKGKAKAAEMIAKRSTPSGRAKAGQGASVAAIKHISRANVDNLGGTPPNPKIAKNPVKSRSYGGTGNKAARRAGLTPTREKPNAWKEEFVEAAEDRLRDRRMERGGVDGNTRYDRPPARKATNAELGIKPGKTQLQKDAEKKYGKGVSAMDIVRAEIKKKHGKGAIKD